VILPSIIIFLKERHDLEVSYSWLINKTKKSIKKIRTSVNIMHNENVKPKKKLLITLVLKKKEKNPKNKGKLTRLLIPCKVKTKKKLGIYTLMKR
jgi:hypothetical protein